MTALDLFDRRCPECDQPVEPPAVCCCCQDCGHPLDDHSQNLDCRTCKADGSYCRCGMDCSDAIRQMRRTA